MRLFILINLKYPPELVEGWDRGMKYQVGDTVLILHSGEEGVITDIINDKMLMVDVKGSGNWMQTLDKIATNTSIDTVFVEQFSVYSIKRIPVGGLVELIFPILSKKHTELYYVQVGNAFMLSDDLRAVKLILEDFDQENTWGKSIEKNRFLESTLLESNISLFADPSRCAKITFVPINRSLLN